MTRTWAFIVIAVAVYLFGGLIILAFQIERLKQHVAKLERRAAR
jgi:hypothetical protein